MEQGGQPQQVNFTVNKGNLYREESFTDMSVASIRKLVPVTLDGVDDASRPSIFIGSTQLMSPQGPVPLQAYLKAGTLEEAVAAFPQAMKDAMAEMMERIRKFQQEEKARSKSDSRIIVPGRG